MDRRVTGLDRLASLIGLEKVAQQARGEIVVMDASNGQLTSWPREERGERDGDNPSVEGLHYLYIKV